VLGPDIEFKGPRICLFCVLSVFIARPEGSVHKLELLKEFIHSEGIKETDFLRVCDGSFTFVSCGEKVSKKKIYFTDVFVRTARICGKVSLDECRCGFCGQRRPRYEEKREQIIHFF
jgi:hypothetical protein